jgi:hypothetical protein
MVRHGLTPTYDHSLQFPCAACTSTQAVKITDIHEGIDFFFSNRAHALKLVDFLQVGTGSIAAVMPVALRNVVLCAFVHLLERLVVDQTSRSGLPPTITKRCGWYLPRH